MKNGTTQILCDIIIMVINGEGKNEKDYDILSMMM